ncbi:hypothetical protein KBTX_04174 [wastewater metagenome]|uniref:Uncharacterized protein n=2 Tax=unclassified sequences TaxID=12908 RepID=A0A5B8RFH7_9ZZZZ|nr:hypothetical protein [Arhodomonas sp. KWT]QEA07809.1 hypothetical protein KBTEX_04174 [uncultured organism]
MSLLLAVTVLPRVVEATGRPGSADIRSGGGTGLEVVASEPGGARVPVCVVVRDARSGLQAGYAVTPASPRRGAGAPVRLALAPGAYDVYVVPRDVVGAATHAARDIWITRGWHRLRVGFAQGRLAVTVAGARGIVPAGVRVNRVRDGGAVDESAIESGGADRPTVFALPGGRYDVRARTADAVLTARGLEVVPGSLLAVRLRAGGGAGAHREALTVRSTAAASAPSPDYAAAAIRAAWRVRKGALRHRYRLAGVKEVLAADRGRRYRLLLVPRGGGEVVTAAAGTVFLAGTGWRIRWLDLPPQGR